MKNQSIKKLDILFNKVQIAFEEFNKAMYEYKAAYSVFSKNSPLKAKEILMKLKSNLDQT